MTLKDYLAKHGASKAARALVSQRIGALIGLSIDDLADNCEMADAVDTVEELLESGDLDGAKEYVKDGIDLDFIEENVYG